MGITTSSEEAMQVTVMKTGCDHVPQAPFDGTLNI